MAYDIPKFLKRKDDSLLFALEDKNLFLLFQRNSLNEEMLL